jgi:hypothetical protein
MKQSFYQYTSQASERQGFQDHNTPQPNGGDMIQSSYGQASSPHCSLAYSLREEPGIHRFQSQEASVIKCLQAGEIG